MLWLLLALALVAPGHASERNHRYKDNEPVVLWVNKVGPFNNPQETYNYYALPYCRARPNERAEHSWGGLGEVLQGNELIHSQLDIKFKGEHAPTRMRRRHPRADRLAAAAAGALPGATGAASPRAARRARARTLSPPRAPCRAARHRRRGARAVPVPKTAICEKTLSDEDVADFTEAITRQYWFELFMDELPMWGYVGEVKRGHLGEQRGVLLYPHWQLDISYNGDRVSDGTYESCVQ